MEEEIDGNRLVWRHIQKEQALVQMLEKFSIPEGLNEEERKMMLDPLGYDAIQDIDEIHLRNRRKSDDPYLKATKELKKMKLMENKDYKRWKNNDAERR
tara:strand:+ start:373 stop:669 length:297 start_codon:yes stop_codon:yes gene_type:complete